MALVTAIGGLMLVAVGNIWGPPGPMYPYTGIGIPIGTTKDKN